MLPMNTQAERMDALAWYPDSMQMRDTYTFKSAFGDTVEAWLTQPSHKGLIGIPRQLAPHPTPDRDFRAEGEVIDFTQKLSFKPRNMKQK